MNKLTSIKILMSILMISLFIGCNSNKKVNQHKSTSKTIEHEETVNTPVIQSPEPIIYLADNLDEQEKLGWCIDTDGRGFSDSLHVHSCKPNGDDVLFYYDEETQQICSATYPGFCAAMIGGPQIDMTLSLVRSKTESSEQKFIYDKESGEFRPKDNPNLCLTAGSESDAAGPYMSRTLSLQPRKGTNKSLKSWIIKGSKPKSN